jgi:hypothetical protein
MLSIILFRGQVSFGPLLFGFYERNLGKLCLPEMYGGSQNADGALKIIGVAGIKVELLPCP